jgi:hypothetical protein
MDTTLHLLPPLYARRVGPCSNNAGGCRAVLFATFTTGPGHTLVAVGRPMYRTSDALAQGISASRALLDFADAVSNAGVIEHSLGVRPRLTACMNR